MTIDRLYLSDAFGWETESTAIVAISQLRETNPAYRDRCPKAQLTQNDAMRPLVNALKILGYIPGFNFIAGVIAIRESHSYLTGTGPDHTERWRKAGFINDLCGTSFTYCRPNQIHLGLQDCQKISRSQ